MFTGIMKNLVKIAHLEVSPTGGKLTRLRSVARAAPRGLQQRRHPMAAASRFVHRDDRKLLCGPFWRNARQNLFCLAEDWQLT